VHRSIGSERNALYLSVFSSSPLDASYFFYPHSVQGTRAGCFKGQGPPLPLQALYTWPHMGFLRDG
jgi:hypothetical protein